MMKPKNQDDDGGSASSEQHTHTHTHTREDTDKCHRGRTKPEKRGGEKNPARDDDDEKRSPKIIIENKI